MKPKNKDIHISKIKTARAIDMLLPCPFCGDEDVQMEQLEYSGTAKELWRVWCGWCAATISEVYGFKEKAMKEWNKRKELPCGKK